jgi:AcrR family transcriptional regulator
MKLPEFDESDGRRRRSLASRERIIEAFIALIDEDIDVPSAENIAAKAGVGLRSVFRHFGDMDALYMAVMDRIGRRYLHMMEPYRSTGWLPQVREGLERRLELFHGTLGYRRAADLYRSGSNNVRLGRQTFEQILRARLESVVPEPARADMLWFEQLDLWLSFDSYASLRDRRRMSHAEACTVITTAVEALLAAKADPAAG